MNLFFQLCVILAVSISNVQAKDVTEVVVLFTPGGVNDIVGRGVSEYLNSNSARKAVVINKPGADGVIGVTYALSNRNDALVVANAGTFVFNRVTKNKIPYDVDRDFSLVVPIAIVPSSLVTSTKSKITTMEEFISAAKSRPLNCGVTNSATTLALKTLLASLGLNNVGVIPYKGTAQALTDLLSGQIDCTLEPVSSFVQAHESGQARIIATAGDRPYERVKSVPLLNKYVPGFKFQSWFGIAIPNSMPADRKAQYIQLLQALPADLEFNKTITNAGMTVVRPSADPKKWYNDEYNKWESIRQTLGIEKVD
jgi:tripartite-type tricarboxylate transporter receptor subunit TctC